MEKALILRSLQLKTPINTLLTKFGIFALSLMLCEFADSQGFTPSAEQVQQFKSMSPAQQKQMAEAAGIDLGSLGINTQENNQPQLGEAEDAPPKSNKEDTNIEPESKLDIEDLDTQTDSQSSESELPLFGRSLFNTNYDVFKPASNVPVPADYVMGPGDTLVIQLYGKENSSYSLVINREGQIQFPQIGPVNLAGLNFSQAQQVIHNIVGEQMIGVKASITMGSLRSIRVFVLGEVNRPGSFAIGSLSTMTNALFTSGGITQVGSLRNVQLKRNGKVVTQLDLYDLLLKGDTSKDSRLLPGDVIFVPPIGATVGIRGAVKRPATYELQEEADITKLIQLAGGLKNTAHLPVSYLIRLDGLGEKTLINVDLSNKQGKALKLQDGDILSISSTLEFINNQVTLAGHIKRAGPRSWRPGLRFTDLIKSPFELLPNPDTDIALLQRFSIDTRRVEAILFSPADAWQNPKSDADPLLQGYDVIQIFDYEKQRANQLSDIVAQLSSQARYNERKKVVNISGNVRFPGIYPLSENMTSKELIQLAGGLTESAIGTEAEITRYEIDDSHQRVVMHINVNLEQDSIALVPGDTLQVKQVPLWKNRETVEILGEVMFPGTYTILPGETLLDVLTRAGGLTPHAYPKGAIFSRQELRNLEQQRLSELKDQLKGDIASSAVNETTGREEFDIEEAQLLMENLDSVKPLGRMVIDLPAILTRAGSQDFQLEDGDTLSIPRFKPSVTVVGEVQYPTSHFYDDSLDAFSYIDLSGGMKKQADKSRVYVVKANGSVLQPSGSVWFKAKSGSIEPGDTIVVPIETDKVDSLTIWAKATQIIYQTALGAAAIGSL